LHFQKGINTNIERKGGKQTYSKDLGKINPKLPKHVINLTNEVKENKHIVKIWVK
jgi:hypothetical protein